MVSTLTCRFKLVFAISLLATSLVAQAQWKWRDAKGRVQYSDLPPPASTPAKDILQSPIAAPPPRVMVPEQAASAAPLASKAASAVDPALEAKRKQTEQEDAAKRKAQEAQQAQAKAQNCERAQAHMRSLESGRRMARTNTKGEQEILDDAARAREVDQTRQLMATDCR